MLFYSTNRKSPSVNFREATIQGQAPDKGLYFPETIPMLPVKLRKHLADFSTAALAFELIHPYVGDTIPATELERMLAIAINFTFPLVPVTENCFSLELFHGPTQAFKDVGARFLAQCMAYFLKEKERRSVVLVATSGDTGGAVASAFSAMEGIHVVILYPAGKVSAVQELQLVTCGKNVSALRVKGNFDDCQRLVKMAFADVALNKEISLTSANSINVARWLPQQVYYADALRQWNETALPLFSVPCGNLGNIAAGILACKSLSIPIKFIAACNTNNTVHEYLKSGEYHPKETVATLSNAMDVGAPSNFVRIQELFDCQFTDIQKNVGSSSISDDATESTIADLYNNCGYIADPHGAVAFAALQEYVLKTGKKGIFLETAHPVKFPEVVAPLIRQPIPQPPAIAALFGRPTSMLDIEPDYESLKTFLSAL